MAIKRATFLIEEQHLKILKTLPNKSRILNNLLALLFTNLSEDDFMKIAYASSHNESLRKELKDILRRNLGIEVTTQTDEVKPSKTSRQTVKETKEKEPITKVSIPSEIWESWW
jgi:hypothetical protein